MLVDDFGGVVPSEINELVAPKYSKLLILTHENSELVQIKTGKKKS